MNQTEFAEGTDLIETYQQAVPDQWDGTRLVKPGTSFNKDFLGYLFKEVGKDVPKEVWLKCCAVIAKRPVKPRDLTMADFLQALEDYRDALAWAKMKRKMAPPVEGLDRKTVYEKILADPSANDLSKSIAREGLEKIARGRGTGPGERKRNRVQGGEKYRRMKQQ